MSVVKLLLLLAGLVIAVEANAKSPITVKLGTKSLTISVTGSGSGPTCVALHSNEMTSVRAVQGLCGKLIILRNGGNRYVTFTLDGVGYRFDPNRIFTATGRRKTLEPTGNKEAERLLETVALSITKQFGGSPLVGLHNNSDGGGYSVKNYANAKVFPDQDSDNFVLTTSRSFYNKAVALGYNAVMDSGGDDGSLSVYAKRAGRPYLNVEAQPGSGAWQREAYQKLLR